MGYFTGSILATGGLMSVMRNSSMGMAGGFGLFAVSIGCLLGVAFTDYQDQFVIKNLFMAGFVASMATSLVPMIHAYGTAVLFDAALATGATMTGLGAVAWNAPSEQFLSWGGPLALGLGGMMGVSLLSIFYPSSPALWSIWTYGGIALFSAFVLYDTQKILYKAKTQQRFDPCWNALSVYLDAINLFVRFAAIFGGNRRK
jgi:FtsH-binding integral membrane protein